MRPQAHQCKLGGRRFCNFFPSLGDSSAAEFLAIRKGITGSVGDTCETERRAQSRGHGSIFNFHLKLNIFIETVRICWPHDRTLLQVAVVP